VLSNENSTAISGASITVKGTANGAIADADGRFTIPVPANGITILVVTALGYVSQDITVTSQTNLVVRMLSASTALDEVVVVGYGEQKKRDLTGAISMVQSKDIVRANPVLAAKAIQGQVAGATVTKASNRPGAAYSITIRGENTINNSTQPLIVIDGLMGGDINTLNPNDIQSMDVLKDASSTSIYGARGANGVVIITTPFAPRAP
jgi:TonB-dependent SusC/RagA subfamily outer membrane receptor